MGVTNRFTKHRIAEAIADERPIDWTPAERALGSDDRALANFRLIDDVARAFRQLTGERRCEDRPSSLFRWGDLEVVGLLGDGQTGEVFRAYDATLQRDVALKLRASRDPLFDPANSQLLAEARRLARIRHRNVLAVYGAAVHDGRAGIWAELIEGRTLASIVADEGPLGPGETISVGLDLCRALGVVHAEGLVHGDVKAENVMRERGGRIVLMDFGAGSEDTGEVGSAVISGTRRYVAPEVLDGTPRSPRSDLYALGVLLYHVLTGAYPRDEDGLAVRVATRRPDVPHALAAAIDAAVSSDPAARPSDAAAFSRPLHALRSADAAAVEPPVRRRPIVAIAIAAMTLVAIGVGWTVAQRWPAWRVQAQFIDPATRDPIVDGTPVRLGDSIALRFNASRRSHVYVINQDSDGELNVLFPLAALDQRNPLPADSELDLPGSARGLALGWQISSPADSEDFAMIASDRSLPTLERRLSEIAHAGIPHDARPRGVDRLGVVPAPMPTLEGIDLDTLVDLARADHPDPDSIHVEVLHLPHARP